VASWQTLGVPADEFGTGPLPGYTAYVLRLASDTGKITGVDFSAEGEPGKPLGLAAPGIHQMWFQNKTKVTTSEQDVVRTNPTSYDSYFIFPADDPANVAIGSALTENNDRLTSPFAGSNPPPPPASGTGDVAGGGTFMRGAWGVVGAAQTTSMNVAYMVLRDSDLNALGPTGLLGTPAVATEGGTFRVPVPNPIPEPAVAGLIGLGLGALGFRRRRA
jgi:hypothetical protein